MSFLECAIATTAKTAEQDAELLTTLGALSVTFELNEDSPLWEPDPNTFDLTEIKSLKALFANEGSKEHLKKQLEEYALTPLSITVLPNKDWSSEWMQHFRPQQVTEQFWILPDWKEMPPLDPGVIALKLAPGLAFGTGAHPTTRLCLKWLATHSLTQKTVLDFGCGSGILAIAACLLGAYHANAIDHDPQALLATIENARQNNVAEFITVGSDAESLHMHQLIIANILAKPLIALAPLLCKKLAPKGTLVLSGILDTQAAAVIEAYQDHIAFTAPLHHEEWVLLCGSKKE